MLRQEQAQNEKRRLRRVLKDFEENFLRETGQRVQKEDRSPMDIEYNQYKVRPEWHPVVRLTA